MPKKLYTLIVFIFIVVACTPSDLKINEDDSEELQQLKAVLKNDPDYVHKILDDHNNSCLHIVSDPAAVDLLVSRSANLMAANDKGFTPISLAVWENKAAIVEALLRNGANPNEKVKYNNTLLHNASYTGFTDIARILIRYGAKVNALGGGDKTPLHYVKNEATARVLILAGAEVNAKDKSGRTPLMESSDPATALMLIERGADVNSLDKSGQTALHRAAIRNKPEIVKILIEHGVDINAKANNGMTALDLIKGKPSWKDVESILIEHDAQ